MKNSTGKGSITVFLSLMLVLLISVITTSLESAHLAAVRCQIGMESEAAVYTLFSHYEKSLLDQYQMLFLNDRQDFIGIIEEETGISEQTGEQYDGVNHLGFAVSSLEVGDQVYLMDNGCAAFQEEVNQIVTEDMVTSLTKLITDHIDMVSQSSIMTGYMNQIMNQTSGLEELADQMTTAASYVQEEEDDRTEWLRQVKACQDTAAEYKQLLEQGDGSSDSAKSSSKKSLLEQLKQLADEKEQLEEKWTSILSCMENYENKAQSIEEDMSFVKDVLQEDTLEEYYKTTLYEETRSIFDMVSETGDTYQQIVAVKETAEENLELLQSITIPSADQITEEMVADGQLEELLNLMMETVKQCGTAEIEVKESSVSAQAGISAQSLIKTVQMLITDGIFSIIVDNQEDLSGRTVDNSSMPSQNIEKETSTEGKSLFENIVDESKDTLALNYYLSEYMDCYTDDSQYDLEYILGGETSDKENLKAAVNQLLLLRQAMNLVYLLTDSVKRQQAQTAAASMLAITGNALVIQGMAMVILTAWAFAEAAVDVKNLLNNGHVSLMKTSEEWNLSLEQAADYRNWKASDQEEESGLDYKEYLRILLFFHSRDNNLYRGLDMIQWNICQKDSDFLISQCVYSVEMIFSLQVQPIFFTAASMERWNQSTGYTYTHAEQRTYG